MKSSVSGHKDITQFKPHSSLPTSFLLSPFLCVGKQLMWIGILQNTFFNNYLQMRKKSILSCIDFVEKFERRNANIQLTEINWIEEEVW